MLDKWLISLAISFLVRQLKKFAGQLDWEKVKADAQKRVSDLLPGEFFDSEAQALVAYVLDAARLVLSEADAWENVLKLVAEGKTAEAFEAIKKLLRDVWNPGTKPALAMKVKAAVAA